jgi:hypothetical protein
MARPRRPSRDGRSRRRLLARALACALACALGTLGLGTAAHADDEPTGSVIFARGSSLFRVDARGRGETPIAQLPANPASGSSPSVIRALRCDAAGTVLLADLDGRWAWMPLDGSTRSLTDLPCADGPAQLAEDGSSVLCRSPRAAHQTILVPLGPGSRQDLQRGAIALDVPPGAVRLAGVGAEARLVWADASGVWSAPPADPKNRARIAADAPLRGFLPSPDGARAVGVYPAPALDAKRTVPSEVLMTLQLDNEGARRRALPDGLAVEWSHDSQWVLVQDGARACIIRATGGQYKCWRGYTAMSLSSDGRWALAVGNRDGAKKAARTRRTARPDKPDRTEKPEKPAKKPSAAPPVPPVAPDPAAKPWDHLDEPSGEPETSDAPPVEDDVAVAPPSGPLSLFRLRLEGAFTERPALLVKDVDGAAVWVPARP